MIAKTSYNTGAAVRLQASQTQKIEEAIKRSLISSDLKNMGFGVAKMGNVNPVFVSGIQESDGQIPGFIHPVLVKEKDEYYLVSDIRAYKATTQLYPTMRDFEAAVKNKSEYALVKHRAALETRWANGDQERLLSQLKFAGSVFANWICQALNHTYSLDKADQLRVITLAIYYYHLLFVDRAKLEGHAFEAAVIHSINATKLPAKEIYELLDDMPPITSIYDFCEMIKDRLQNLRLRDFNLMLLLEAVKHSWYGNNAKELIAVALEYPPAWIVVVYAALTERTYKSSMIYKLIEAQAKRTRDVDEFLGNFVDLVAALVIPAE